MAGEDMETDSWRYYAAAFVISSALLGVSLVLHVTGVIDIVGFTFLFCFAAFAAIPIVTLGCLYRVIVPGREGPPSLYDKLGPTLTVLLATAVSILGIGVILFLVFVWRSGPKHSPAGEQPDRSCLDGSQDLGKGRPRAVGWRRCNDYADTYRRGAFW